MPPVELLDPPLTRDLGLGNIPSEVDTFIGREQALVRLRELQSETRLLTLVGPGGVGKTRLALRLEALVREDFPDGTWLVDLSCIADPALVPQALGDVLGVRQQPGQSMLGELRRMLRPRRLLLILDNCEHLVAACAKLVDGLLYACPRLRVLATSIQPLGAASETTWRVAPLSVPDVAEQELEALQASEAVRLFVARVQAHWPDFTFGKHNAHPVAQICRRLDGLPLALELAAARVESLGIAEVATRVSRRFELAVSNSSTAPPRHRTLQATLDWSCGLLSERELMLLRRVSVFMGGWTLDAAEAVCGDAALPAEQVVDLLSQLVSKSLVVADHDQLSVRYRLLETVRAHALARLAAAGETRALQHRHANYLLRLGHLRLDVGEDHAALSAFAEATRRTRATGERFWLIRALEGCARWLATSDPEAAVRLAGATDAQRVSLGIVPWPSERQYLDIWLWRARRDLGPVTYARAWEDGHASTLAQAVSLVEALTIQPEIGTSLSCALTPREREVAMLLARGLTNKQIAANLIVSPATVRSHVEHILSKLDLRSRAQIAVWATQQGLLPAQRV